MSLREALEQMFDAQKKLSDRFKQWMDNLPEPGEIQSDLTKVKTEKDFVKQKKQWKVKLDSGDWVSTDIDKDIDAWNDKISKVMEAHEKVRKENDITKNALENVESRIKANNKILEAAGLGLVDEKNVAELGEQRKMFSDATKIVEDARHVIDAQKKLIGKASATAHELAKKQVEANTEFLKQEWIDLGSSRNAKGIKGSAPKPGKRR